MARVQLHRVRDRCLPTRGRRLEPAELAAQQGVPAACVGDGRLVKRRCDLPNPPLRSRLEQRLPPLTPTASSYSARNHRLAPSVRATTNFVTEPRLDGSPQARRSQYQLRADTPSTAGTMNRCPGAGALASLEVVEVPAPATPQTSGMRPEPAVPGSSGSSTRHISRAAL